MTKKIMQRTNKTDRQEVLEVLKGLWTEAFTTGEVIIDYKPGEEEECTSVLYSLQDYRKKIKKKALENYEMCLIVDAVMVSKKPLQITLTKKNAITNRTGAILALKGKCPAVFKENKKSLFDL